MRPLPHPRANSALYTSVEAPVTVLDVFATLRFVGELIFSCIHPKTFRGVYCPTILRLDAYVDMVEVAERPTT